MSKSLKETRTYELELVPIFWNFLLLIVLFLGLLILATSVSQLFLIPWFFLWDSLFFFPNKTAIIKKKKSIKLFEDYLEIVENKKKIPFKNVVWFSDRDNWWFQSEHPTAYFAIKEKGQLFAKGFSALRGGDYYQNFIGFKGTTIRRIKAINPDSLPWTKTVQGKIAQLFFIILIVLTFGIFIYESPYLFLGIILFLIFDKFI